MLRTVLAVVVACLFVGVLPAQADEDYAETLLRQKIWDGYNEGWAVRTATTAELSQEEYRIYLVTLYAGNQYRILGVGDKDVANLDLVLHDSDGNTVRYDETADPQPELQFTPDSTATYFVVVHARSLNGGGGKAGVGMAVTYK
jgi:hypothetical protein